MQDLTSAAYYQNNQASSMRMKQPELLPQEQEQLKCPRCDSANTKFCYYNNYNLSQPRHFCKNCRRYWTKGGSLRNIPVGGGSRKNFKRSASSSSSSSSDLKNQKPTSDSGSGSGSKLEQEEKVTGQEMDPTRMFYGLPVGDPSIGSFSSLLASNMQMGGVTYEAGSGWLPGMGMGMGMVSGFQKSEDADDKWTDLTMQRMEKN